MHIRRRCGLLLLLLGWALPLAAQGLQPFASGSYQAIIAARADQPFVMAFWSIDCPPCYAELKMFAQLQRSRPFDLVLIATDGEGAATEVSGVLKKFGLDHGSTWLFAEPAERLRFEIDRTWYGELPRSYLFGAGRREAISGTLKTETLEAWLDRHRR